MYKQLYHIYTGNYFNVILSTINFCYVLFAHRNISYIILCLFKDIFLKAYLIAAFVGIILWFIANKLFNRVDLNCSNLLE